MTQPNPTHTAASVPVAEHVIADLRRRTAQGVKTYGVPLSTHNGRSALQDAYEEALDLAQYLKQAIMEQAEDYHAPADQAEAVERVARSIHLLSSGYHSEAKAQANYALNLLGFPNFTGEAS